jgi:drug/metabolite transporter (DMT)-like permease
MHKKLKIFLVDQLFEAIRAIWRLPGVGLALGAAALFGASTPAAKLLLGRAGPWIMAALLYLGAGTGLALVRLLRDASGQPAAEAALRRPDLPWLAATILTGGVLGPLFLMIGLARTNPASASLRLNLEGIATMVIAWIVFHENADRQILLGAAAIVAGAGVLSWAGQARLDPGAPWIMLACLCWGIDNNLTRKLSAADPMQIAMLKGLVAGAANLALACVQGAAVPGAITVALAMLVGFFGYGLSLALFVRALRYLGAARTGAYFSLAPFIGALLSLPLLGGTPGLRLVSAGVLMAAGLWLHLKERHVHEHAHEEMAHEHRHIHDAHHQHAHDADTPSGEAHTHWHRHAPLRHSHVHYPDLHHRHRHLARDRFRLTHSGRQPEP